MYTILLGLNQISTNECVHSQF